MLKRITKTELKEAFLSPLPRRNVQIHFNLRIFKKNPILVLLERTMMNMEFPLLAEEKRVANNEFPHEASAPVN